jgi:hypothetical protein
MTALEQTSRSARQTRALHASRRLLVLITLLLGAAFVFCHGCHAGDHDDELVIHCLDRDR